MKRPLNKLVSFCCLFLIAFACTKDVGLITEVEFQFLEEHTQDGFINQGLPTTFTIIPEAEMDGFEYDISYDILQGNGYFEDVDGNRWDTGAGKSLPVSSPLTTALLYIGTELGEHRLSVTATDNFGFSEALEVAYNLENVPARWEATSDLSEIELGKEANISLVFERINTTSELLYEARFEFTTGSGSIVPLQDGGYNIGQEYGTITQGTYSFVFTPLELGSQQITFVLRDSNGQEIKEELIFIVAEVIDVISISLGEEDAIELQLGEQVTPDITFNPSNATDQGFTLVSSNPAVVFINENNVCIAEGLGTAIVTATSTSNPDATDIVTVTVVAADRIPVTSITISQEDPTATGSERQLIAAVFPENATDPDVTWASDDETIATINEDGLLTGLMAGSVTITATSVSDPDISDDIIVEISGGGTPNETDITAFELPGQNNTVIDPVNHTITVNVPDGTELNVAPSTLSISGGATIEPGIDQVNNFNNEIIYTVTAGDTTSQDWTVNVTVSAPIDNDENDITLFELPEQNSSTIDFDNHTITVDVPDGTYLFGPPAALTISANATIDPLPTAIRDYTDPTPYIVTAQNGEEQEWIVFVTVSPPSEDSANDITVFELPIQNNTTIDNDNYTITINVPNGTDLNVAPQTLTISAEATVSPAISEIQNFNNLVTYTVTAANGNEQPWTVNVVVLPPEESDQNDIVSFELPGQNSSTINTTDKTVTVNVPDGTDLNVVPVNFVISPEATITPTIDSVQDFSNTVTYIVTAENGDTEEWTIAVTVSQPVGSGQNEITAFELPVQNDTDIDDINFIITVNVPDGTNLGDIAPAVLTISPQATVSPSITATQNFNSPVEYTVLAENGTPQIWTVNTTVAANVAPTAVDDAANVEIGKSIIIDVLNNDTDQDSPRADWTITAIGNTSPSGFGNVIINYNQIEFTSTGPSGEPEIVSFDYTMNDGNTGNESTATVTVNIFSNEILVTDITIAPTSLTLDIAQTAQLTVDVAPTNATNSDVNWSSSDVNIATVSSTGFVTATGEGPATITAASNDSSNVVDTITVTVNAPLSSDKTIDSFAITNRLGIINNFSITVNMPTGTDVTALSPFITFTGASISPISGAVTDFTDPVEYTVTAEDTSTIVYTVTVIVESPTNNAPTAQNDAFTVAENGTLNRNVFADNGQGVDNDLDMDSISVDLVNSNATNVGSPATGSLGGSFTISANGNLFFDTNGQFDALNDGDEQTTTITYRITDGNGGFDTATVSVTVTGISTTNSPPTAESFEFSVRENSSDNEIDLTSRIEDSDLGDDLVVSITTNPSQGTATIIGNIINYTPNTNYDGADTIGYTVDDGNGGNAQGIISISVEFNRPPVADARMLTDFDKRSLTRNFSGSGSMDPDGDTLTYQWNFRDSANPIDGATGEVSTWDFSSADTYDVTLTVFDGYGGQDSDTITVVIELANVLFSIENGDFNIESLSVTDVSRQWSGRVTIYDQATTFVLSANFIGTTTTFTIEGETYSVSGNSGGDVNETTDVALTPGTYDYEFSVLISNPGLSGGGSVNPTIN